MGNKIELFRGDSAVLRCSITDNVGSVFSLSGATAKFTIRATIDGAELLTKSTGDGITNYDEPGGILDVTIDAGDTAGMSGNYVYDIEVTQTSNVYTVVKGTLTIKKDVTHN